MDDKSILNNNVEQYFTADAWTALSLYEKRRYENVLKKYESLKSSGITPKMPEFMMAKFKRPRKKTTDGQQKGSEDPKADFKLFAVPNTAPSKRMISNKVGAGATSDISMVMETNSPSSKTMTRTIINFRGVKPNEFGKNIMNSARSNLKVLEDLFKVLDLNNTLDDEDEHQNIPKRRNPKRKIAKKSYKEKDVVKDEDEFLDCDLCKKEHKGPCPVHGAMLQVLDTKVPKGDPERAKRTLPYFFSIGISSIPKAGLGVWTEMPLIEGMVFGPFEGEVLKKNEIPKASEYMWEVKKRSKVHHCVDAADKSISNWMRYVNCADDEEWQTMTAFQYMGKIYYKTYKPVLPYTEILIWYGDDYASKLGIEPKGKKLLPPPKEITGFPCGVCNNLFSSSESLRSHRKTHPRMQHDGRHRCPECSYSSDTITNLRDHMLTHSGATGPLRSHRKTHPRMQHDGRHRCPECSYSSDTITNLRDHMLTHSGATGPLRSHRKTHPRMQHDGRHRCPECSYSSDTITNLRDHMLTHSGATGPLRSHRKTHPRMQHDGRHRCPECSYSSDTITNLRDHMLTHYGEKPHACPHCPKRFSREYNLRRHLLLHKGQKEHAFTTCGKRFAQKFVLKEHERVHTGGRPYRCPSCGKDFTQVSVLKVHGRLHTRQRPYPCPHCEHRFTRSLDLTRHIASKHTRVFPHNCSLCGKGFNRPTRLKMHAQRKHSETGK